jgi:hypothetical protein
VDGVLVGQQVEAASRFARISEAARFAKDLLENDMRVAQGLPSRCWYLRRPARSRHQSAVLRPLAVAPYLRHPKGGRLGSTRGAEVNEKTVMTLLRRGEEERAELVGQLPPGGGRSGDLEELRTLQRRDWRTTARIYGKEQRDTRRETRRLKREAKRKTGRRAFG